MNETYRPVIEEVAKAAGIANPEWLSNVISFETGGTWSTTIKNPLSSGRGLIQFINDTARWLGYADSLDLVNRNPTVEAQLRGPVLQYFKKMRPSGYPTEQSVYMGVFYPKYMSAPLTKAFPADTVASNPGIRIVADYVAKVRLKAGQNPVSVQEMLLDEVKITANKAQEVNLLTLGIIVLVGVFAMKYIFKS
jgi:hypothetical protein